MWQPGYVCKFICVRVCVHVCVRVCTGTAFFVTNAPLLRYNTLVILFNHVCNIIISKITMYDKLILILAR